jgi:hypothetical protein
MQPFSVFCGTKKGIFAFSLANIRRCDTIVFGKKIDHPKESL